MTAAPLYEITGQLQPHLADNFHSQDGEILVAQDEEDVYLIAEPQTTAADSGGDA